MDQSETTELVALTRDTHVLAQLSPGGLRTLPHFIAPEWLPEPSGLQEQVGDVPAIEISPARHLTTQPHRHLHVLGETSAVDDRGDPVRADLDWCSPDDLDEPSDVLDALRLSIEEAQGSLARPARRPDWFRIGWLAEADQWIDQQLAQLECVRLGPSTVIKLWSLSAVLGITCRSRTDRHAAPQSLFFKATCDYFGAEPAITQALGEIMTDVIPSVLTIDHDRHWMLMEPIAGVDVQPTPDLALTAARSMATLQVAALDQLPALLDAGCPDRTLKPTLAGLSMIIHDSVELGQLTSEEQAAVTAAEPWLAEQVTALYDCGLPSTIAHGDLHVGNVARDGDHLTLFDWTDGAITHPFLDAAHLARDAGDQASALLSSFAEIWRRQCPAADIDRALSLAPLVNRIYQAITYERLRRAQEDAAHCELSGVVARYLREFAAAAGRTG